MKNAFLLTAFLFFTAFMYAQKDSSRFSIGVHFSPDYCYRTVKVNDPDYQSLVGYERPKFGYTTGITALYRIGKHLELEAGVLFSNKGFKFKTTDFEKGPNGGFTSTFRSYSSYYCLDIPVSVNYLAGKKRLQFIGSLSVTPNIYFQETDKAFINYAENKTDIEKHVTKEKTTVWLTPEIGAGISYKLSSRITLRAVPRFRYTFTRTNEESITRNFWSVGLNVGAYLRL